MKKFKNIKQTIKNTYDESKNVNIETFNELRLILKQGKDFENYSNYIYIDVEMIDELCDILKKFKIEEKIKINKCQKDINQLGN